MANQDVVGAKKAVSNYELDDPNFDTSNHKKLILDLVQAIEDSNNKEFIECVQKFTKMH
jgi:hypothetical protein